VRVCVWVLTAV